MRFKILIHDNLHPFPACHGLCMRLRADTWDEARSKSLKLAYDLGWTEGPWVASIQPCLDRKEKTA